MWLGVGKQCKIDIFEFRKVLKFFKVVMILFLLTFLDSANRLILLFITMLSTLNKNSHMNKKSFIVCLLEFFRRLDNYLWKTKRKKHKLLKHNFPKKYLT